MPLARLALTFALGFSAGVAARAASLGIGDPAPVLRVEGWLKDPPVTSFQKGQVYVVEFWATWCGPCRRTIPHLTELQRKYAAQGLRVVGVNIFEHYRAGTRGRVEQFVQDLGENLGYPVAYDGPAAATADAYMKAAGQNVIPTAFLVDRQGRVAWIGHPLALEKPLEQVLDGSWNLETGRKEFQKRMEHLQEGHRK